MSSAPSNKFQEFIANHTTTPDRPFNRYEEAEQWLENPYLSSETRFNQLVRSGVNAFGSNDDRLTDTARSRLWEAVTLYNHKLQDIENPHLQFRAANAMFVLAKIEYSFGMPDKSSGLLDDAQQELAWLPESETFDNLSPTLQEQFRQQAEKRLGLIHKYQKRIERHTTLIGRAGDILDNALRHSLNEVA
ncbi:TPA: hypothetical protein EYO12_04355 [Candidatus Saccharibacteria bacterium]|nr:hypothetical protein [Candidatus Saccharibacteria bacterium]HIO87733.1 hypothetical protein [Candidatus Saccharibacteria bacterium]